MVPILGECPVCTFMRYDGLNDGKGAGRACWMVPHSPEMSDTPAGHCGHQCYTCEFYKRVVFEEEEKTCFKFTSVDS